MLIVQPFPSVSLLPAKTKTKQNKTQEHLTVKNACHQLDEMLLRYWICVNYIFIRYSPVISIKCHLDINWLFILGYLQFPLSAHPCLHLDLVSEAFFFFFMDDMTGADFHLMEVFICVSFITNGFRIILAIWVSSSVNCLLVYFSFFFFFYSMRLYAY